MSQIYDIFKNERIDLHKGCARELKLFPTEVMRELISALSLLLSGHKLSMPHSRPMPSLGKRVHELRFKDISGAYRVVYFYETRVHKIVLLHAFKKKTQTTPKLNLEVIKKRLKGYQ